jgi:hypothetical protein
VMEFEIGTGVRRFELPVASGQTVGVQDQLPATDLGASDHDLAATSPVEPADTTAGRESESPPRPTEAPALEVDTGRGSELSEAQEVTARGMLPGAFTVAPGQGNLPGNILPAMIGETPMARWHAVIDLSGVNGSNTPVVGVNGSNIPVVDDIANPETGDAGNDLLLSSLAGNWRTTSATAFTTREVLVGARTQDSTAGSTPIHLGDQAFVGLTTGDVAGFRAEDQFLEFLMDGDDGSVRGQAARSEDRDGGTWGSALAPAAVALAFVAWAGPSRHESRGVVSRKARRPE